MWEIQIDWNGRKATVATYRSQQEAEWAAAKWRQQNDCRGDPFHFAPVGAADSGEIDLSDSALAELDKRGL